MAKKKFDLGCATVGFDPFRKTTTVHDSRKITVGEKEIKKEENKEKIR